MGACVALRVPALLAVVLLSPALAAGLAPAAPPALRERLLAAAALDVPGLAHAALRPVGEGGAAHVLLHLAALQGIEVPAAAPVPMPSWLADAPPALRPGLGPLAEGLARAEAEVRAALAGLSAEERQRLADDAAPARAAARGAALGLAGPGAMARADAYARVASKVQVGHLVAAELALLDGAQRGARLLAGATGPAATVPCAQGLVLYANDDCSVVVGAAGANTYTANASLVVDLGGADTYANNAGGAGTAYPDIEAALVLDLGGAGDAYRSDASAHHAAVQGSGWFGAGLLLDDGGDDAYGIGEADMSVGGRISAQGSGLVGAGVLWDQGQGQDRYASRNAAQGVGLDGIGLLLDEGGRDAYLVPWTFDSEAGQGTGCWGGLGALVDRGAEDDTYDAAVDDLQGMGCLGALGLLWDGGGRDTHVIHSGLGLLAAYEVAQSGWGQGYGELGGLGLLYDGGGDDLYEAEALAAGTYPAVVQGVNAQGAGLLGGAGVLLDDGGQDQYTARSFAQGSGAYGLGALRDAGGDDRYAASVYCEGQGAGGLGLLSDEGGGADRYGCLNWPMVGVRGDDQVWVAGPAGLGRDA
jgi:hypothetical protein